MLSRPPMSSKLTEMSSGATTSVRTVFSKRVRAVPSRESGEVLDSRRLRIAFDWRSREAFCLWSGSTLRIRYRMR
jgi:hypothetical protein